MSTILLLVLVYSLFGASLILGFILFFVLKKIKQEKLVYDEQSIQRTEEFREPEEDRRDVPGSDTDESTTGVGNKRKIPDEPSSKPTGSDSGDSGDSETTEKHSSSVPDLE